MLGDCVKAETPGPRLHPAVTVTPRFDLRRNHAIEQSVASYRRPRALDDTAVMHADGGVVKLGAQRPYPRQRGFLIGVRGPAVADKVRTRSQAILRIAAKVDLQASGKNSTNTGPTRVSHCDLRHRNAAKFPVHTACRLITANRFFQPRGGK